MVQILKRKSGFTMVEILVASLILSIGALAFFAMVKTVTTFSAKARSNDAAYSIARQRLSLMQDGEILVRPEYKDSTTRDGTTYYTVDQVDTVSANEPLRLTVSVTWGNPSKTIQISGYLNREICPDTAFVIPPDSISISNKTIPENAPSNTLIGELKVYDKDSSDLHMFLYSDTIKDNQYFKVSKGKLYTTKPIPVGDKIVELGVTDCAGNDTTFDITITVTPENEAPDIAETLYVPTPLPENSIAGKVVYTVPATPLNVTFRILAQTPTTAFSIGTGTGVLTVANSSALNYESSKIFQVEVEVKNLDWYDTGTVFVTLSNVNERPSLMTYSGIQSTPVGIDANTYLGRFTITDPDSGDTNHTVSILTSSDPEILSYITTNSFDSRKIEIKTKDQSVGTYLGVFKAVDAGGLFILDTLVFAFTDTVSGSTGCGSYLQFKSGVTYNAGERAYESSKMYIYQAKWWTQSQPSLTNADWKFFGACDGKATCSDFAAYANGREYNAGALVAHAGKIWTTNTYVKNKIPPTSPWSEVEECQ